LKILTNEELYAGRSCVVLDNKSKYQRAVVACMPGIDGMVKLFLVDRGCYLARSECWKSEAYFAHLSSDFPSSKWTQGGHLVIEIMTPHLSI
jgi:hypothetical protein